MSKLQCAMVMVSLLVMIVLYSRSPNLKCVAKIHDSRIYKCRFQNQKKIMSDLQKMSKNVGLVSSSKEWNANHLTTARATKKNTNVPRFSRELVKTVKTLCKRLKTSEKNVVLTDPIDKDNLADYWINVYTKGHGQGAHNHMNDDTTTPFYCFTYFAKYDKAKDAPLRFYTDLEEDIPSRQRKSVTLDIDEGDIVFFPPNLEHSVDIQTTNGPRITVSGNVYKMEPV